MTGSAADSFSDDPWVVRLRALLAAAERRKQRLLGVCFGCQVLAVALQGDVRERHLAARPTPPLLPVPITAARGMRSVWSDLPGPGSHGMLDAVLEPGPRRAGAAGRRRRAPVLECVHGRGCALDSLGPL